MVRDQLSTLTSASAPRKRSLPASADARLIVDSIPGMVAVHVPGGEHELVNRQLLEYFGTPEEELKRWATGDSVHPEDLPLAVEVFTRSMASGEPFELEVRVGVSMAPIAGFSLADFRLRIRMGVSSAGTTCSSTSTREAR